MLMLKGKIETRNRPTNVRGKVLICSCKKPFDDATILRIAGDYQYGRIHEALRGVTEKNGYAVAIGDLVDCRPMTKKYEDACFVRYIPGLWCWIFKNVQAMEPFPIKGKQGWSILDEETIGKIKVVGNG